MVSFFNQLKSIVSKSATFDRIIILGKGSSIQEINQRTFEESFIITLNDAEWMHPGNLCLYHQKWVYDSLVKNGLLSEWYVSNGEDIPSNENKFIGVPYELVTFDSLERYIADFSSREFILTDFLILSALKLAGLIAQIRNRKIKVYLLGFDFQADETKRSIDKSGHEIVYKNALFATQKAYFRFVKDFINDLGTLDIIHVGKLEISDMTIEEYNRKFLVSTLPGMKVFDQKSAYQDLLMKVKDDNYVITVAEFTNNHLGNEERLRKMVGLAKTSGADMIKVQKRDVNTFYSQDELKSPYQSPFGTTLRDYREGVELDDHLFNVLVEECASHEIVWFASVLDYPSLKYIEKFDPVLIKLPSTISNHKEYHLQVAENYQGDVVISTGFTDKMYEKFIIDVFLPGRNLFLLQCTSSYPAPPEACQVGVVRKYDELSSMQQYHELIPGYSSHDVGSLGSMMAVAAGAKMVEKHVKLGNVEWVHFDSVALDLLDNSFFNFVSDIRKATIMTGSKEKRIHHQEHHKYKVNS